MTADLDTRARAAASSLHNALADRPLPSEAAPRRTGHVRTVLTAAAVVVAVAALATALLWPDNDEGKSGLATTSGEVPRLVPTYVPDGLELAGATEVSTTGDLPVYSVWVYGDPDAPHDPFAARDLSVYVVSATGNPDGDSPLPSPGRVTLADLGSAEESLDGRSPSVTLDLGNGQLATVASRTLSDEEVVAFANELRAGDPLTVLPTDLPEGLALLAADEQVAVGIGPGPVGEGFAVGYESQDAEMSLTVTSSDVDPLIPRFGFTGETAVTEVDGTTAWTASDDGSATLVWVESGATITVSGVGLSSDELVRVAESLEAVDDATWASMLEVSNGDGVTVDRSAAVSVVDALDDGGTWSAYVDADDSSLCLEVPTPNGSEGSCDGASGPPPELRAGVSETSSGELIVYGTTTLADVDTIELSLPLSTAAIPEPNGGGTLFAGAVAPAELPAELIVSDAATGQELGRMELEAGSFGAHASASGATTTTAG